MFRIYFTDHTIDDASTADAFHYSVKKVGIFKKSPARAKDAFPFSGKWIFYPRIYEKDF